jgi:GAF domain-containing protein/HAMP domain-containing protein
MAKPGFFKPGNSIRSRLLVLLLAITTLAIALIALVAILVNQVSGKSAQKISSTALQSQAESYLVQLTKGNARENDLVLDQVKRQTQQVAEYTAAIFDSPEAFSAQNSWKAEEHMAYGPKGQYANTTNDISSVFVPEFAQIDTATIRDIELGANLEHLLVSAYHSTPNVEALYFATVHEVTRYYPNIDLGSVLPPDFKVTGRIWFTGSTLADNPEKKSWWSSPYVDATGRGLVTTAAAPVYTSSGDFVGVIGLDLTLKDVISNVESSRFLHSGYSFLIDNTGRTIAIPEAGFKDLLGRDPQEGEINVDLTGTETSFSPIIDKMIAGESGFTQVQSGNRSLFVAYAPLKSTGWSLGSVIEAQDVLSAISTLQIELDNTTRYMVITRILPISALALILVAVLGLFLANRLVAPIQKLTAEAQKIGAGEWDINITESSHDEVGILTRAFGVMAEQIHSSIRDLEKRVSERTHDLERRNTQLQVAAEISREATAVHDLDELLELAVNLIRGRFGFYHAGIFLLDDKQQYAVLRSATGEAGREMLARGHKLKVGQVGMVGYVTSKGQPRIAPDVETDPAHYKNPLLPDTRAEMTLPLMVGEKIIGALDVQSQYPNAFTEDDITIMQVMADQLAIAIENARLIQESQENLHHLEMLYGSYSHKAWKELGQSRITVGYQYDPGGIKPIQVKEGDSLSSGADLAPLRLPIQVRGQTIATLDAWPQDEKFDAEAIALLKAIAERLSQTLENARLFQETRLRAEAERLVAEVAGHMRETLDIETILQTAAVEFRRALNLDEAEVRLGYPSDRTPGNNGAKHNEPAT